MHLEAFYRTLPLAAALSSHTALAQAFDLAISAGKLIARPANSAHVARPEARRHGRRRPESPQHALVCRSIRRPSPTASGIELLLEPRMAGAGGGCTDKGGTPCLLDSYPARRKRS
jgi:hypothetical protein